VHGGGDGGAALAIAHRFLDVGQAHACSPAMVAAAFSVARRNTPWRSSSCCSVGTSTWRGSTPADTASAAAAPAAWSVTQHCGISRMKPCELRSQETWRPQASRPSRLSGTNAPYGMEMLGNLGETAGV